MKITDISKLNWTLTGIKPYQWAMFDQIQNMKIIHSEQPPIKARIPASVQQLLLENGILPDWNIGLNSRLCEWVENRHWLYSVDIPDSYVDTTKNTQLRLKGVDDNGEVWLNGVMIGEFNNAHTEHIFDLRTHLQSSANHLSILFKSPERYLGQSYWTSKTCINKSRYYYGWDWCPRLVQIGFTNSIQLEVFKHQYIENLYTTTELSAGRGNITVRCEFNGDERLEGEIELLLKDNIGTIVYNNTFEIKQLTKDFTIENLDIQPWYPNLEGDQPIYLFSCVYRSKYDQPQIIERKIGFRNIEWLSCEGAREDADKWLLSVNGRKVFMQGVNWTPIRVLYADVTQEQYREMLLTYKKLGANLLRVWGGATLESEYFYTLCDELGLMVWQEFPISSSGMCSTPPTCNKSCDNMSQVVESYINRRHFHCSLIAWSGGNELYTDDQNQPLDFSHPILNIAKQLVDRLDPTRRIMPTSPSGPTKFYDPALNGQGIQWDVHGPWCLPFEPNDEQMSNIKEFWSTSDALFHSEAGVAGSCSVELINKYKGECNALPASIDNPLWAQFSWWLDWDHYLQSHNNIEPETIDIFVEWHQKRQATALTIAVREAKRRFPCCGGFIIWMGHDAFPAVSNTSIIDYDGCLKPAAESVSRVWLSKELK